MDDLDLDFQRQRRQTCGLSLENAVFTVELAQSILWEPSDISRRAVAYLRRARGLSAETIRQARLGLFPNPVGFLPSQAQGVVIPLHDDDGLALLKIGQPDRRTPRWVEVYRDRPLVYPGLGAIRPGTPVIVCASELDALLLGQELADLASVITMGSAANRPASEVLDTMMHCWPWYLAFDPDDAGDQSADNWPVRAQRVRRPRLYKHWTAMHRAGCYLREWWSEILSREGYA
jgi:hypothetical protein